MRDRYLKPRNSWEIAWNAALDLRETAGREWKILGFLPDSYHVARQASDRERKRKSIPREEWNYEECRRYTLSELEDRKKLEEWASRYMPDEDEERKKCVRNMNGSILYFSDIMR